MSEQISLVGLDKAAVLAALYNASKPQGMGFLHYNSTPMTTEQAQVLLDESHDKYFDYLSGRVMKVNLSSDELDTWAYDRDNGKGAAAAAIEELQTTGDTNSPAIEATHHVNTVESAETTRKEMARDSRIDGNTIHMGLSDVADVLEPAVQDALNERRK